MADKLMYIPNDDTQNYSFRSLQLKWLKKLDTQLNEPTNQDLIKVSKVILKLWGLV